MQAKRATSVTELIDLNVVVRDWRFPVVEAEILTFKRLRVILGHQVFPIEIPDQVSASANDGELVNLVLYNLTLALFFSVFTVFVEPSDDIDSIIPTSKDQDISGLVNRLCREDFAFQIALWCGAQGIELHSSIVGQFFKKPEPFVVIIGDV